MPFKLWRELFCSFATKLKSKTLRIQITAELQNDFKIREQKIDQQSDFIKLIKVVFWQD
jgi:hypothetical protein